MKMFMRAAKALKGKYMKIAVTGIGYVGLSNVVLLAIWFGQWVVALILVAIFCGELITAGLMTHQCKTIL